MATSESILKYSNAELAAMTDQQIEDFLKVEGILEPQIVLPQDKDKDPENQSKIKKPSAKEKKTKASREEMDALLKELEEI